MAEANACKLTTGYHSVIKNTGHDFMGKSIGAGSLSIWTHQLKNIKIIDKYSDKSTSYTGSAVTFGAGWQTADIYNTLNAVGKVIVGGECAVGSPQSTCIAQLVY